MRIEIRSLESTIPPVMCLGVECEDEARYIYETNITIDSSGVKKIPVCDAHLVYELESFLEQLDN